VSFVDLPDGARIHYEIAGEGPAVTLIHPGLWDMRTWAREFEALADAGYRVLRYDVRGYGQSSRPEPGATYSHVRDLEALLEANEIAVTALVGCSMGGGIELDYALVHPEQVWALVAVATGLGGFEATEGGRGVVGGARRADRGRDRGGRPRAGAGTSARDLGAARHLG
jgi:3-oxoadipate enol-lactonase